MAYPAYSMTLAALDRVGSTLTNLNALDLARKEAATQGELRMAQLASERKRIEGQQEMSLAELGARNEQRKADLARHEKERTEDVAARERDYELRKGEVDDIKKQRERTNLMSTPMPLLDAFRTTLEVRGAPKEIIEDRVREEGRRLTKLYGADVLGRSVEPQKYDDWLSGMDDMAHATTLKQLEINSRLGTVGKPGSVSALMKMYEGQAKYLAEQLRDGNVKPDNPDVVRQLREFKRLGWDIFSVPGTRMVDGVPVESTEWSYKFVDPFVAAATREEDRTQELYTTRPWLRIKDSDDEDTVRRKVEATNAMIQDGVFGNVQRENAIDTQYKTNVYTEPTGEKQATVQGNERTPVKTNQQGAGLSSIAPKGTGPNLVRIGEEIPVFAGEVAGAIASGAKATARGAAWTGNALTREPRMEFNYGTPLSLPPVNADSTQTEQRGLLMNPEKPKKDGRQSNAYDPNRMKFASDLLKFVNYREG